MRGRGGVGVQGKSVVHGREKREGASVVTSCLVRGPRGHSEGN